MTTVVRLARGPEGLADLDGIPSTSDERFRLDIEPRYVNHDVNRSCAFVSHAGTHHKAMALLAKCCATMDTGHARA
jgi:hypothetical protein